MVVVIVSGTPGTGKTTISRKLAEIMNLTYLEGTSFVKENNLGENFDKEDDCWDVDIDKFSKAIENVLKHDENIIIDSHLSHYIPCDLVDVCIITTCELKELENRLKLRKYSEKKIRDNLDSEIFSVCEQEARQRGHNVIVIDTTNGVMEQKLIDISENIKVNSENDLEIYEEEE